MKLAQVISAYKALGEAKIATLEDAEALKVVKARKAMRSHVNDYDEFLKDCQEKFKPSNFDELQEKAQKWNDLSDEEKIALNKELMPYQQKIANAANEELGKDIELTFDKLNEESAMKILKENGWELNKLDEIEILL